MFIVCFTLCRIIQRFWDKHIYYDKEEYDFEINELYYIFAIFTNVK